VSLAGVSDAYSQHADAEPKGIKAHFRVDDGGLLYLDKVYFYYYYDQTVHAVKIKSVK